MADNRLAYGLAKKHGIDTEGMTPKQVWEALKKAGIDGIQRGSGAKSGSIRPGEGELTRGFDSRKSVYNLDGEYNMPGTRRTINPGKYSKESKAYENRIKTEFGIPHVDISQIDVKCAEDIYTHLKTCYSIYPFMRGFIKSISYDYNLMQHAQWDNLKYKITLGHSFGKERDFEISYNKQVKNGVFLTNTSHKTVVAHEFGHALDKFITGNNQERISFKIVSKIYEEFGLNKEFVKSKIASYAASSYPEFFAMHFQDYVENKENSSNISKRLIILIREEIKNAIMPRAISRT